MMIENDKVTFKNLSLTTVVVLVTFCSSVLGFAGRTEYRLSELDNREKEDVTRVEGRLAEQQDLLTDELRNMRLQLDEIYKLILEQSKK